MFFFMVQFCISFSHTVYVFVCFFVCVFFQCLVVLFTVSLVWPVKWPALFSLFIRTLIFNRWSYRKINAYYKTMKDEHILVWMQILCFCLKDMTLTKQKSDISELLYFCVFLDSLLSTAVLCFIFTLSHALKHFVWHMENQEMCVWIPVMHNFL